MGKKQNETMGKKHNETPLLSNHSHQDAAKLASHEEKLEELHHKIHQLQSENMLKEKVRYYNDNWLTNTYIGYLAL